MDGYRVCRECKTSKKLSEFSRCLPRKRYGKKKLRPGKLRKHCDICRAEIEIRLLRSARKKAFTKIPQDIVNSSNKTLPVAV